MMCSLDGERLYVHRLVAEAFVENPERKREVNFKDRCRSNCDASNLEWMSPKENKNYTPTVTIYKITNDKVWGKGKMRQFEDKNAQMTLIMKKNSINMQKSCQKTCELRKKWIYLQCETERATCDAGDNGNNVTPTVKQLETLRNEIRKEINRHHTLLLRLQKIFESAKDVGMPTTELDEEVTFLTDWIDELKANREVTVTDDEEFKPRLQALKDFFIATLEKELADKKKQYHFHRFKRVPTQFHTPRDNERFKRVVKKKVTKSKIGQDI